jgi:hypothetical protein
MTMVNRTKKQVKYKQQAIVAINRNSNFRHMNKHLRNYVNLRFYVLMCSAVNIACMSSGLFDECITNFYMVVYLLCAFLFSL